ncbi:hypothetical protein GCM10010425_08770 [Streptomyces spororaveus]|uniref:Uncharacterized protein n=1 Tax=Streptomyces spororaveus TaxID=284039 RepID=A0ABQ3TPW0_9ACTN|nr:hypothetical protein Sspor_76130 [Streptomyces spororaveus]
MSLRELLEGLGLDALFHCDDLIQLRHAINLAGDCPIIHRDFRHLRPVRRQAHIPWRERRVGGGGVGIGIGEKPGAPGRVGGAVLGEGPPDVAVRVREDRVDRFRRQVPAARNRAARAVVFVAGQR